jgi:hypothetical protein
MTKVVNEPMINHFTILALLGMTAARERGVW